MSLLEKAKERLEEAIENGTHDDVIYWRGYRDAAKRAAENAKRQHPDSVIAQFQTGKSLYIIPVDWRPGKTCDLRVTVEGVVPDYAALRTRSKFLTCEQLKASPDPAALASAAVRELLDNFPYL